MSGGVPEAFPGTQRFQVRRRLGAGGFGVVYEAVDRTRNTCVALKVLSRLPGKAIYRFKQEFRAIADISHPNLVTLYELLAHDDQWFFTMEKVDGVDFISYVRARGLSGAIPADLSTPLYLSTDFSGETRSPIAAPSPGDGRPLIERLRPALGQVAEGLIALHEAGKLHGDIKPSNVLVTSEGRVVILDFGLVRELDPGGISPTLEAIGTPAYMSPEQVELRPLGEPSDWYNVGSMLYEALTGRLPFVGTVHEIILQKLRLEPRPCQSLAPQTPSDLDALCHDLLRRRPEERPTGREVRLRLQDATRPANAVTRARPRPPLVASPRPPFVGRGLEIGALWEAFRSTQSGATVTVAVHGDSGMGKTALVRRFLQQVEEREPNAVVLSGRCHERESVPYKAVDGIVDALSRYLRHEPPARVEQLLPRDVLTLIRLFPVLGQIDSVKSARGRVPEIPSSQEFRRRAFAALRDLMSRLADQEPLLLFIDDLQWGDSDGAALLAELLRPPDPPALLLIVCYQTAEAQTSPLLRAFLPRIEALGVREIVVGELPPAEARELALELTGRDQPGAPARAEAIALESGGNPFFIGELVHYAHALPVAGGAVRTEDGSAVAGDTTLDEVIHARLSRLPAPARRLLEIVALAGQPVAVAVAVRAAAIQTDEQSLLASLGAAHLVRIRETEGPDEVEIYHNRMGAAVIAGLEPEASREHSRQLAMALEASTSDDPETLAVLFERSGHQDLAARHSVTAAVRAAEALAFDRAARLYRLALKFGWLDEPEKHQVEVRLADALANAGRGAEAGRAYLSAASAASSNEKLDLQRRAAEQLLVSGHVDEGLAVARTVLGKVGITVGSSPRWALVSLVAHRAVLRLRGFRFRERDATRVPPDLLNRIDTCWSLTVGLIAVDVMRAADFGTRHTLLALRAGEPSRVARALLIESTQSALNGGRGRRRADDFVRRLRILADQIGDPYSLGLARLSGGVVMFLQGRWREGFSQMESAGAILRERCTGVSWELAQCQLWSALCLFNKGEVGELARRLPALLEEARERGNVHLTTSLVTRVSYIVSLAEDSPDKARAQAKAAIASWSREAFHFQHLWALFARAEIDLYSGEGMAAWKAIRQEWRLLLERYLLHVQNTRILAFHLRARCALATTAASAAPEALLRGAERDAQRIESERMPWGDALAQAIRAGVAEGRGDRRNALSRLALAEDGLGAADMSLHAAAVRRRRGELLGNDEGRSLVDAADAWMQGQGIVRPGRMTAMLVPMPTRGRPETLLQRPC